MVFLDASAIIHATEDTEIGVALKNRFEAEGLEGFAISPLVRLESTVGPLRTGNRQLLKRRLSILDGCRSLSIEDRTYSLATHIRAAHRVATADAIHLATAGNHDCDQMITSDKVLLRVAPGFAVDVASAP